MKYREMLEQEEKLFVHLEARAKHLAGINPSDSYQAYFDKRLQRVLLDYMLRKGYFESAKIYAA